MDELKEKIAKLPVWAREHIAELNRRADPNNNEVMRLRIQVTEANKRARLADDRVSAMLELFTCAAKGGHETAQELVARVLANWLFGSNNCYMGAAVILIKK